MKQLHKQFSDEEVKQYLKWYEDKVMTKSEVLALLGIKDSRFYALLAKYRNRISLFYGGNAPPHGDETYHCRAYLYRFATVA